MKKLGFSERRLTNQNFIVRLYSSVSDKFKKKKRRETIYICFGPNNDSLFLFISNN